MKKILFAVGFCLLAVSVVRGDIVVTLDNPTTGQHLNSSATTVTTTETYNGATFDINYTLGSNASGANPFAQVAGTTGVPGTQIGVGSDADIAAHYTTLEGNDGEGLAFTNLSITNFNAGTSGLVVGDITNLRFINFSVNNANNAQDGVTVSYAGYAGAPSVNVNLNTGGAAQTIDLTSLGNYSATADDLYLSNDNTSSRNRWAVTGIVVEYDVPAVPEPTALGLLGLGGVAMLARRRRS